MTSLFPYARGRTRNDVVPGSLGLELAAPIRSGKVLASVRGAHSQGGGGVVGTKGMVSKEAFGENMCHSLMVEHQLVHLFP